MGFLKRLWGYIATLFRRTAEGAMNPEIEIEQAINDARKRDQALRNQAAKVVAHRTQIESKMEKAADDVGEAREMAKRMELLGSLEAAKMQESVNKAVDALSNTMDYDMPSLEKVEEKIEARKATAMAKAELHEATPAGAESELKEAINMVQADAKLEELKAELGLTS